MWIVSEHVIIYHPGETVPLFRPCLTAVVSASGGNVSQTDNREHNGQGGSSYIGPDGIDPIFEPGETPRPIVSRHRTQSPVTGPNLPQRNSTADNQKYRCAVVQLAWIINVLTHSLGFPARNQSVLASMLTGAHFLPSLYNQYADQSTFSAAHASIHDQSSFAETGRCIIYNWWHVMCVIVCSRKSIFMSESIRLCIVLWPGWQPWI